MEVGTLTLLGQTEGLAQQTRLTSHHKQTSSRRHAPVKSCSQLAMAALRHASVSASRPQDKSSWFGTKLHLNQPSRRHLQSRQCAKRKDNATVALLDDVPHLSEWISHLPKYQNPLQNDPAYAYVGKYFVDEHDVVVKDIVVQEDLDPQKAVYFRRAGPRKEVVYQPEEVRACIVTCGGLCPGLNTVIREVVYGLWHQYGVRDVFGIDGGYRGFYSRNIVRLSPKVVNDVHKKGGTILHTSRGGHDLAKIVNAIEDRGINQVYIIGGDGTQRGANVIHKEIMKRGLKVSVAGIPKTIDNDIPVIDRSFGFDTAVEEAQRAINAAHVEAESVENGLGLVKVMGRYSGYIAMYATLASRDVDLCLIPEVPFYLEGEGGLYEYIHKRMRENGHMVLVVAEGAGQELMAQSMGESDGQDASGNRLLLDVGLWLSHMIKEHFVKQRSFPVNLKYIDPTYMIRAVPSNASDNVYCTLLAHSAIHGAMAGYTGFITGPVNGRHAYIPIERVTETANKVNVSDRMWARLLSSTQQPSFITAEQIQRKETSLRLEQAAVANGNGTALASNGPTPAPGSAGQSQSSVPHLASSEYVDHMEEAAESVAKEENEAAGQ